MTHFKVGFLEEEWRKQGPFASPLPLDKRLCWHIMAYGRKDWPEPVLVAIVFSDGEADLILADHALGQRVGMVVHARDEAVAKIQPPEGALIAVPN